MKEGRFRLLIILGNFHDFHELAHDVIVVLASVRYHACGAILDTVLCISEITSAFAAKGIKRTIAEEAVELVPQLRMARVVLAGLVGKKTVGVFHYVNRPPFQILEIRRPRAHEAEHRHGSER